MSAIAESTSIEDICAAVALAFDVPANFATTKRRSMSLAYARFALFRLLRRRKPMMSLMSIGDVCGNRDHGTVIHGLKRAAKMIEEKPVFRVAYEKAEELLEGKEIER